MANTRKPDFRFDIGETLLQSGLIDETIPIQNQENHPLCYAFSCAKCIEIHLRMRREKDLLISIQHFVDCAPMLKAKTGRAHGKRSHAYNMLVYASNTGVCVIKKDKYEDEQTHRAFTGRRHQSRYCKCEKKVDLFKIKRVEELQDLDNDTLIKAFIEKGPYLVTIRVDDEFKGWKGGETGHEMFIQEEPQKGDKKPLFHSMVVRGCGRRNGREYLILQNSWGNGWGTEGCMDLFLGDSTSYHPIIEAYIPELSGSLPEELDAVMKQKMSDYLSLVTPRTYSRRGKKKVPPPRDSSRQGGEKKDGQPIDSRRKSSVSISEHSSRWDIRKSIFPYLREKSKGAEVVRSDDNSTKTTVVVGSGGKHKEVDEEQPPPIELSLKRSDSDTGPDEERIRRYFKSYEERRKKERTPAGEEWLKYKKQIVASKGFDVDFCYQIHMIGNNVILPPESESIDYELYQRFLKLAADKACELEDLQIVKANKVPMGLRGFYYITFIAKGSSDGVVRCYQSKVTRNYRSGPDPTREDTLHFVWLKDECGQVTAEDIKQRELCDADSLSHISRSDCPSTFICKRVRSNSAERNGKMQVQMKKVWNWFQSKCYAIRAKSSTKPPVKLATSQNTRDGLTVMRSVHHQPMAAPVTTSISAPTVPSVARVAASDTSLMEFEAKSARDGAWHMETGDPEVLVRFSGFGEDEDEWVNVRKHVRQRSLPCEASECVAVLPGDLVLCFQFLEWNTYQLLWGCIPELMVGARQVCDAAATP